LQVSDLKAYFFIDCRTVRAVDSVSFTISRGRTLGLVGESGCGKTATALSIMRLLPSPPGRIVGGQVLLDGEDILSCSRTRLFKIRATKVAMVFQDPFASLDPVYPVGEQVAEAVRAHYSSLPRRISLSRREAWEKAVEALASVKISDPDLAARRYPHELSGGMRQRVLLAMAFVRKPELLIADEPTTALDVTVQAEILQIMRELRASAGTSVLLVTHDLGVVSASCDDVAVMYAGEIVERASAEQLLSSARHPYTQALLSLTASDRSQGRLPAIAGQPPDLASLPVGCYFAPRCPHVMGICYERHPLLVDDQVRCFLYGGREAFG